MREEWKVRGRRFISPVVSVLVKYKVHPNILTVAGLWITVCASILYAEGAFRWGALVMLFGGLFDAIDGEVARRSGRVSVFGAFLDSTLDRFSDFFIFGGLIYYYRNNLIFFIALYVAVIFTLMISYIKARAEGLGYSPRSGPMDRAGRYFFIVITTFLGPEIFRWFIFVFIILVFITVVRRWKELYNYFKINNKKQIS